MPNRPSRAGPGAALLISIAAAAALAACATSAPPIPPDAGVDVADGWSTRTRGPAAAADAAWWSTFNDPVLSRLVAASQENSTTVATARASLREARALRDQAAASLFPSVSAGLGVQLTKGSSSPSRLFDASLDASWEADVFGAMRHSVSAQEALVRASQATLESTRVSIAAEVALAYLDLRNAQARAASARASLESQQQTLQIARWREQAGLASSLEVEQASTSVEQTRAQIPLLESSAATSAHAIAVLIGQAPQAVPRELRASAAVPQPSAAAVSAPAQTLRRRPDVLAAQERLRSFAELVGQADARRRPQLDLAASVRWSGLTLGSLGSVSAARSVLASLAAPVFDAGLRDAQLAQRQAQFEAAVQDYRAAVLAALQEVEDALVALEATRDRLGALRAALESARNASTLATHRYEAGVIDFLTVLETQRTLLSVQDNVATAEAELARGHVRLFKALGGGWEPLAMENHS